MTWIAALLAAAASVAVALVVAVVPVMTAIGEFAVVVVAGFAMAGFATTILILRMELVIGKARRLMLAEISGCAVLVLLLVIAVAVAVVARMLVQSLGRTYQFETRGAAHRRYE